MIHRQGKELKMSQTSELPYLLAGSALFGLFGGMILLAWGITMFTFTSKNAWDRLRQFSYETNPVTRFWRHRTPAVEEVMHRAMRRVLRALSIVIAPTGALLMVATTAMLLASSRK